MTQSTAHQPDKKTSNKIEPSQVLAAVVSGLLAGVIAVSLEISFAVLIFSGELANYVSNGIGLFLFGTLISIILTSLVSSYRGMVTINQDVPAAILAVMAATLVGGMSAAATADEMYLAVVAAIMVTSLLTGLAFLLQGYFKLGSLFRFLPFPVVGGFLAGTGWLLASGGLTVMTGAPIDFGQLSVFVQPDMLLRWIPGTFFAFVMLLAIKRFKHYLIMPGMILGAAGLFYLLVLLFGMSMNQVSAQGWLLGPFPEGVLWRPFPLTAVSQVPWSAIFAQTGNIAALLIVSTIALLLNASGLELTVEQDIQLDRELQASGLSTIGSGLVGGLVSYPGLSLSILGYQISGSNRIIVPTAAAVLGITLVAGPNMLSWTPKMIFGGLLMYLGLSLLDEWVYKAWFQFSRIDYLIIISILVVIAAVGFLQGLLLGVVLAIVLFVVNYSRISVIKNTYSGANYQSRVTRSRTHQQLLNEKGDQTHILQLQSFIFFGTANSLLEQVRQRIEATDLPQLRFIVLDFKQVTGLDSTATLSFTKMVQLCHSNKIVLVLTNPSVDHALTGQSDSLSKFFTQMSQVEQKETVHIFADLDHGLEWCENQILLVAGINLRDDHERLQTQLQALLPDIPNLDKLLTYFERLDVDAGYYLMKQDDLPDNLYFIESGQVTAQIESPDRQIIRLETMRGGRVVGEIGFYLNQPRTAAVVTDEPSTIYRLTKDALKQMEQDDSGMAFAFHQGIIRLISERLTNLINTVDALQQ